MKNCPEFSNENQRQGFLLTLSPFCHFRPRSIRQTSKNPFYKMHHCILFFCFVIWKIMTNAHCSTLQFHSFHIEMIPIVGGTSTKCINNNFVSTEMLKCSSILLVRYVDSFIAINHFQNCHCSLNESPDSGVWAYSSSCNLFIWRTFESENYHFLIECSSLIIAIG